MKQITQIGTLTSLVVWLLAAQTAAADSPSIWNGGGNDNNWNNAANWNGNLPVPGLEYDLQFGGSIRLTPFNDFPAASDFRNITFNAGAGAFTLGGYAITLSGDIANESSNPQTLNLGLALTGMRTVTTATGGGNLTLGGDITGAGGGLVKRGAGTLTLSGANTYEGGTTNEAGNFVLTGSLNNSAGALAVTGGKMTISGAINTGTGHWLVSSAGKAVLNVTAGAQIERGTNFLVGNLTNFNGALNISGGSLISTQTWGFNNFSIGQYGYGALTMSGGDVLSVGFMLGSGNSPTGIGIGTISGGTYTFTNNVVVPYYRGTAVLTVSTNGSLIRTTAGNLNVNQHGDGRGELNLVGGTIDTGGGVLGFGTGSGAISGGSGIVNLNAGTLATARFSAVADKGANRVNFNGATLRANLSRNDFIPLTLTSAYVNGPFGTYAGGAVIDTADFAVTAAAPLRAPTGQGVSALAVTDGGSGYIGAPYVKIEDSGTGLGATAIAHMVDDGTGEGTLKVDRIEVTNPGVDYTAETTSYTFLGGAPTIAATPGAVSTAANTSAGLTKLGGGTLTLAGTNSYAGPTIIREGTLTLNPGGNVDVFSAIPAVYTPSNIVFDGGTLSFSRSITLNVRRGIYITENGGTIGGASASASAAPIEGPGVLTKTGAGRLTLYGPNTFEGGVNFNAGKIRVNNYPTALGVGPLTISGNTTLVGWGPLALINNVVVKGDFTLGSETAGETAPLGFLGTINLGDATRVIAVANGTAHTFAGMVSGDADVGIHKAGTGLLSLTAANTYPGSTTVAVGALNVSSAQTGGGAVSVEDGAIFGVVRDASSPTLATASLTIGSIAGATVDFVFPNGASTSPLINASALTVNGSASVRVFGGGFAPGRYPLIKYGGSIQGGGGFASIPLHLPADVAGDIVEDTANGSIDLVITSATPAALTWFGTVSATWDFSTLNWMGSQVATTFGQGDSVTLDDTAAGYTGISLSGELQPTAVAVNNTLTNYSLGGTGSLAGAMTLTKDGDNLLTISATNTYSGGTVVNAGTLRVSNQGGSATGSGAVTVQVAGTLAGNGIVGGPVTVGGGGMLSPGNNAIGRLTVNNTLTLNTGSAVFIELSAAAGTNDVVAAGAVNYGGALEVTNLAGAFVGGESYKLFEAGNYNGNFAATNLPALDDGLTWNWNPATGTLSVSGGTAVTPTNLTFSVNGSALTLAWPESHLGWFAQSNAVSVAAPGEWYDIAGSENGTNLNIIINPALPQVFYRLRQP